MQSFQKLLFLIGIMMFATSVQASSDNPRVIVTGSALSSSQLSLEEQAVLSWTIATYDASYVSLDELANNPSLIDLADVIWWHSNTAITFPAITSNATLIQSIQSHVNSGKGLFLSGFATQWVVKLGFETTLPQEVSKGDRISGNWGFKKKVLNHPIFQNLPNPFLTLSSGNTTENVLSWWTDPSKFNGIWLADTEWDSGILVTVGEYKKGYGKVIVVGAGAFDWQISEGTNTFRSNLELFTRNIIQYLKPEVRKELLVISTNSTFDELEPEVKAAYSWAESRFNIQLVDITEIWDHNVFDNTSETIIWWHEVATDDLLTTIPAQNVSAFREALEDGAGLLLSGTASMISNALEFETESSYEYQSIETLSSASGFSVLEGAHPIFRGVPSIFLTLSSGLNARQRNYIWKADQFSGWMLADTEFKSNTVSVGEYILNNSRVIVVGSPAFDWYQSGSENTYQDRLEQLAGNIFDYISLPRRSDDVISYINFDNSSGTVLNDTVASRQFEFFSHFDRQIITGPKGQAGRFDGYTTWLAGSIGDEFYNPTELSIETWFALESNSTGNLGLVSQYNSNSGYILGIDNIGRPFFRIRSGNTWQTLESSFQLPLREWVNLTAVFNGETGMYLYYNGYQIASLLFDSPRNAKYETTESVLIGRNSMTGFIASIFPSGVLNGYLNEVVIRSNAMSPGSISDRFIEYSQYPAPDFRIPKRTYENDIHRPRYHPMPTADWTNEPHGLIEYNGEYHLFFQKNPTGPFFQHLNWGHLVSKDLVNWNEVETAFGPRMPYDRAGTWSGAVLVERDTLFAFYTGVDGSKAVIALAHTTDGRNFERDPANPLIPSPPQGYNHMDFRDPYLWKHDNTWYMIIGSGIHGEGGVLFLYSSGDMRKWDFIRMLQPGEKMANGIFWEMPVMLRFGDKWALIVIPVPTPGVPADMIYWTGEWVNNDFIPDHVESKKLESINHLLSPSVVRMTDTSYVAIGIVPDFRPSVENYNSGWVHTYNIPRVYTLQNDEIHQAPYTGLKTLRGEHLQVSDFNLEGGEFFEIPQYFNNTLELTFTLEPGHNSQSSIEFFRSESGNENASLLFDSNTGTWVLDLNQSSMVPGVQKGIHPLRHTFDADILNVQIFLDRSIVEVFINHKHAFAKRVYPSAASESIMLRSLSGNTRFSDINVWKLQAGQNTSVSTDLPPTGGPVLFPNYPNPFNPGTTLPFYLSDHTNVSITVYDILGRRIKQVLSNSYLSAGNHQFYWDGRNEQGTIVATGVYIYKLKTDNGIQTRLMTLIK